MSRKYRLNLNMCVGSSQCRCSIEGSLWNRRPTYSLGIFYNVIYWHLAKRKRKSYSKIILFFSTTVDVFNSKWNEVFCFLLKFTIPVTFQIVTQPNYSKFLHHDIFRMGLSRQVLAVLEIHRTTSVVFLENLPQMMIQLYHVYNTNNISNVTVLAFISSSLSILTSIFVILSHTKDEIPGMTWTFNRFYICQIFVCVSVISFTLVLKEKKSQNTSSNTKSTPDPNAAAIDAAAYCRLDIISAELARVTKQDPRSVQCQCLRRAHDAFRFKVTKTFRFQIGLQVSLWSWPFQANIQTTMDHNTLFELLEKWVQKFLIVFVLFAVWSWSLLDMGKRHRQKK